MEEVEDYFPLPIEPKLVLDIGANIGAFIHRAMKQWPDAQYIACEPMPFNVAELRMNFGATRCYIVSAAIRAETGVDEIFIGDQFVSGGFRQLGRETAKSITVECLAANRLPSCDLVKIDTEGCEVEIVRNLDLSKTQAVVLEYHSAADRETLREFLSQGFELLGETTPGTVGTMRWIKKI
jgi:FkbM family methyltransferase